MAQAALLSLQIGKQTDQGKDASQQRVSLKTESQEDFHLAEGIERALHATGYWPLRSVEVAVQSRVATLSGRVPSYYLKQVAQTAAQDVSGIHRIQNDLDVV